jgi:hypothetical protein
MTLEGSKRNGKTRKEAQERLNVALSEHQQGMGVTGPQQKYEQFFVHWLESVHKQSIRERTYERYEHMRRLHLLPDLGHHPLEKLSAHHLQWFSTSKREEGLSATTIIRLQVHENA